MRQRQAPSAALVQLMDQQEGIVSREQAIAHGLGQHSLARLMRSEWDPVARGIYYTRDGAPTWRSLAWAGVLLGGPGARLGLNAAGFLHGLVSEEPVRITVLHPEGRIVKDRSPWNFRREAAGVRATSIGIPPRTRIDDTVLDLCARDPDRRVPHWLSKGVQSRRTTATRLLTTVMDRQRIRHRAKMLAVLQDVNMGADSPLEIDYLNKVERAHGLPHGLRQSERRGELVPVATDGTGQTARVIQQALNPQTYIRDVYYVEFDVLVELDGRLGHELGGAFRDMWRDNVHVVDGQSTLRYGWVDVAERCCAAARQVALVLARHGWTGTLVPCPLCRQR